MHCSRLFSTWIQNSGLTRSARVADKTMLSRFYPLNHINGFYKFILPHSEEGISRAEQLDLFRLLRLKINLQNMNQCCIFGYFVLRLNNAYQISVRVPSLYRFLFRIIIN